MALSYGARLRARATETLTLHWLHTRQGRSILSLLGVQTSQGSHAGITGLSRAKLSTLAQEAALRSVSAVDDDSRHRLMQFFRFHAFYM